MLFPKVQLLIRGQNVFYLSLSFIRVSFFLVVSVRICLSFFTHSFLNNKMSYFREPNVLLVESPLIEGICARRLGSLWRSLAIGYKCRVLKMLTVLNYP